MMYTGNIMFLDTMKTIANIKKKASASYKGGLMAVSSFKFEKLNWANN